jgi:phosphoglycolate phosphatase-like HAD superfamily hydrolase
MKLQEYLSHHPKKYLIFDLDGTLARLNVDWSTVVRDIFDFIATFDKDLIDNSPFTPEDGITISNIAAKKHGKDVAARIRDFVEKYEISHYISYTPNHELIDFIRTNIQTYTFYMWTGNGRKTIQDFLTKESLSHLFSKIITQNDVSQIKPEAEGFYHFYSGDSLLSEYLLIGDTFADEGAAKNAGIDFYQVDYFANK